MILIVIQIGTGSPFFVMNLAQPCVTHLLREVQRG